MDPNSIQALIQKFLAMFKGGVGSAGSAPYPGPGAMVGDTGQIGPLPTAPKPMTAPPPISPAGSAGSVGGPVETGVNTGLSLGSMIPGPQQPFIMAASAVAPMIEGIFGGKSTTQNTGTMAQKAPVPPATPLSLPMPSASTPRALPTVGSPSIAGPSSGGSQPSMAALIQALMKLRGSPT